MRVLRRSGDPERYDSNGADIRNLISIIHDSVQIFERNRGIRYLEGIRVNNKTYARVKNAAGLAYREPVGSLINEQGESISDDIRRAEMLTDHVQESNGLDLDSVGYSFESLDVCTADGSAISASSH